jgi:hypothetical protein
VPRIRPLAEDEAPEEARPYYAADRERYGRVLSSTGIYAYAPQWLGASRQFGPATECSTHVPPGLRALLNLFVARYVGCPS